MDWGYFVLGGVFVGAALHSGSDRSDASESDK